MSSDFNLLKSNAKGEPLKGQEGHGQTAANAHNKTSFAQQHREQKAIAANPLPTIHGYDIPATKIVQDAVVHHVDFGHGRRDITTDKHGNVTKVFNPANNETWELGKWELGKTSWKVSQPGCKTWYGREMTVSFNHNPGKPELKWQVNSKEASKTLDKENGFNSHHTDFITAHHFNHSKKSYHGHNVVSPAEQSSSVPILPIDAIAPHNDGQVGAANTQLDAGEEEAKRRFFASGISPYVTFKNADLGSAVHTDNRAWLEALKRSNLNNIPGADPALIDSVAQLAAKNTEHKAGPLSELKSKIADLDNHIINFDKKVASIIFHCETYGQKSEAEKFTNINPDPNRKTNSVDLGHGQWLLKKAGQGLMSFFDSKKPELFDIAFGNGPLPENWREIVGDDKLCAVIEKNIKSGAWKHDYTAQLLDKDEIIALDSPLRNSHSEIYSRMKVALAAFKNEQIEYKAHQVSQDNKIFDGNPRAIGAYRPLTLQAKGVLQEIRDNDGARMMVPILAHRSGCNGLVTALNRFAATYRNRRPETHDQLLQMLSDSLPRQNAGLELGEVRKAMNSQPNAPKLDDRLAYEQ